jgi:hypothetical protein
MQSTFVMLAAHVEARGRAMGILSACIGDRRLVVVREPAS